MRCNKDNLKIKKLVISDEISNSLYFNLTSQIEFVVIERKTKIYYKSVGIAYKSIV